MEELDSKKLQHSNILSHEKKNPVGTKHVLKKFIKLKGKARTLYNLNIEEFFYNNMKINQANIVPCKH